MTKIVKLPKPTASQMAETHWYLRFLEMMAAGFDGASIHAETGMRSTQNRGFWASVHGQERQADPNDSYSVATGLAATRRKAIRMDAGHVGVWVEGRNGRNTLVFDVSKWFLLEDDCLTFARQNGQRAIWDCANGRPINVD